MQAIYHEKFSQCFEFLMMGEERIIRWHPDFTQSVKIECILD
jgi:hypothetical protein